jgi:hypothetical protein
MEKSVLLMFLGGVPNSPNIIRHWLNMNTRFDTKDNVYVVVHPISLPYTINEEFRSIFKAENVYVVDDSHHVATMWGTLSLVDAELLMMQYGHRMKRNKLAALGESNDSMYYYDKYILVSNTCCPLYTLDVIYSDVLSDEKSIVGAFHYPTPKYQSQWMVLDKQHVQLFFTVSSTDTYEKDEKSSECQTTNVPKILNRLKVKQPAKPTLDNLDYAYFYDKRNICHHADELFFIEYMTVRLRITDHLRILTPEQVVRNIKSVPLDVYYALKRITESNKEDITHLDPIILGRVPYHIEKGYMDTRIFTSDTIMFVFPTSVLGCTFATEYNPSNVLRDFSAFDLNVNDFIRMNASPRELLSYVSTIITDCHTLRARLDINETSDVFSISRRPIVTTINHPIEYSTYTLRSILNTFILLYKISCLFNNTILDSGWNNPRVRAMRVIMIVYLTIISKEFGMCAPFKKRVVLSLKMILQNRFMKLMDTMDEFLTLLHKKYVDMPADTLELLLNKKYGTIMTNDTLLSAICNQSYFIRKCYDSSRIETFSDVLKTLPMITSLPEPTDESTLSLVTPERAEVLSIHFSYACPRSRESRKKNKRTKKSTYRQTLFR